MPKLTWLASALSACALIITAGCTKQARLERHLTRGDQHAKAGDYDKAEIEYRNALQLEPSDPEAMGRIGILYYNDGRIVPGYLLLQKAVKDRPNDLTLQVNFGLASLTVAKSSDARVAAKKVLDGDPANEEALLLLVESGFSARDNEEARRMVAQLQAKSGDLAVYHVALGAVNVRQRDRAGAEKELRRALELDPKSSAAYAELGSLYLAENDLKQAGPAIKTAAELAPIRSPRHLKYIDFLLRTGARQEAKREIEQTTQKAPDFIPAWSLAMRMAADDHDYDACLRAVEKILSFDPINFDALLQRVVLKLLHDETDAAIVELERISRVYDHAPEINYQLAVAYQKNGDIKRAEEQLNQALRIAPLYPEAILLLAEINVQRGNPSASVGSLMELLKRQPDLGRATILLARAYRAKGDLAAALSVLQQSQAAAPRAPEPPYLIGNILLAMNRRDEARKAFEQSVQLGEDYWPAVEMLVTMDLEEKHSAAAAARVVQLIAKHPQATPLLLLRSKIRLQEGEFAGAEADLLRAIELEPKSGYAYFQLSKVYLQQKQPQQAIDKLIALAAKTNSPAALMQLGVLYDSLGKLTEARATYEKLIAATPRFVPALNNLAVLCSEKMGQLDAGFAFAKRAYNVAPADAIVADTLGWIFFLQGQYDSALPLLLQAASGAGDSDSDVQYHLAMAHYFLAREDPARVAFTKVLNSAAEPKLKEDARRRLAVLAIDVATADASVRAQLEARAREDEHDPLVLGRLAAIERRDGAVAEAARHYEAALKLSPHSAKIMSLLVELYLGPVPQPRRARDLAKAAHELAPTDVQISGYLGHLLYYAGEYAWAAALLEEASGQLPNPEDALYDLAFAYYNLGRARDVGAVMRKFLARSPTPVKVQSIQRLAAMIAAGASPDTATAALPAVQRILEKEPDYLPALFIQALAVEKQGDYERARKNYEAILDRHPAFALATRQLALIYAERLADDQKAEDLALTARKTLADDPQLAYEMGAIQYRRSDYVAAIRFLEQSTQLDDRNGEGHFLLGMCRFHLKKFSESRASLQRALERGIPDQEGDEARRVLGDMNRLRVQ